MRVWRICKEPFSALDGEGAGLLRTAEQISD